MYFNKKIEGKIYQNIPSIAKNFDVSKKTIYNWMDSGLKYKMVRRHKFKPQRMINTHDVVDFLGIDDKPKYHKVL